VQQVRSGLPRERILGRQGRPPPVIARKDDCQTCFMCELYCPVDALYVAPQADAAAAVSEPAVIAAGLLGSYREAAWAAPAKKAGDQSFRLFEPH
jgi:ferredoxin